MKRLVILGLLVSAFLAGVVSYYASSRPDGFERTVGILVEDEVAGTTDPAPAPDYKAAIVGVFVTFVLCVIVGSLAARRRGRVEDTEE